MAASIGVYPFTDRVYEILSAEFYSISNRDILAHQMLNPVIDIVRDVKEGRCSAYIGWELFRQWEEHVNEDLNVLWAFPTWEELMENDWWMDDMERYESGSWEWVLFCDDDALSDISYSVPPDSSAQACCQWVSEAWSPGLLLVHVDGERVIYVVHSETVRNCTPIFAPPEEAGPDDFCDASDEGPTPTYVLPQDIEDLIEEAEEEYERWYEETYKLEKAM